MEQIPGFLISPAIFLGIYFFLKSRYPQDDFQLFVKAFFWGIFMIIPVILADQAAHYLKIDGARSIRRMFAYSFVIVAFIYELSVFLPLRFSTFNRRHFKGPINGIIYTTAITLGLTSIYAIYYVYFCDQSGLSDYYFWSMGPINTLIAVILGFFTGLGKIRKNQFIDSMTGLGAATVFLGIYRFALLSSDIALFWMYLVVSLLISAALISKSSRITAESD